MTKLLKRIKEGWFFDANIESMYGHIYLIPSLLIAYLPEALGADKSYKFYKHIAIDFLFITCNVYFYINIDPKYW